MLPLSLIQRTIRFVTVLWVVTTTSTLSSSSSMANAAPTAAASTSICTSGVSATAQKNCVRIPNNSWNAFRLSMNHAKAGQVIVYCPFLILKPKSLASSLLPATPQVKATFACSVPGACIIRGSGRHVLLQDRSTQVTLYGFVFQNATDTAVRVAANATLTQTLCRVYFESNSALHGGAIRTDPSSSVIVLNSIFKTNTARVGGAISNHGKLTVTRSTFSNNQALGGAIEFNTSGTLLVTSSLFSNNKASQGQVIYVNALPSQVPRIYRDGGGNKAIGASCTGLYRRSGNTASCRAFLQTPVAAPVRTPVSTPVRKPTAAPANNNLTYIPPLDPSLNALPLVSRTQPRGYFNFNTQDPDFGPNAWRRVDIRKNPYHVLYPDMDWDTTRNQCGSGGFQSPIDLYITTTRCLEQHQVRARGGNWKELTRTKQVVFEVTPTRLWLQIKGNGTGHPIVDLPRGIDPLYSNHVEVTIPSLHTFRGRRYDAEMSVYNVNSRLKQVVIYSVAIDARRNIFNLQFQKMLTAWNEVASCGIGKGRRLLHTEVVQEDTNEDPYRYNRVLSPADERGLRENATISDQFNLFDIALFPSIYFYGYKGSLVVPPCTKTAQWRVLDRQMKISFAQLRQLRKILNRGPCQKSKYRNGQNAVLSRPLQPASSLDAVWHCTKSNFLSDCERFGTLCPAP